ncbi:MAG: pantetheine-phosphate adenylyltransferase [Elusimicrobia bacterium]|nr:pantetheine-phosphate adenylyltransferase [Elusimicrobiota bacterium]
MKRIAVYPGSFDPVTYGHVDIVRRATALFDHVIIAVTTNQGKPSTFPIDERLTMLRQALRGLPRVTVEAFEGLLVHYLQARKARIVIRGLRAISDFEYEFQMALMNRHMAPQVETVFLMPDERYTYLSSSLVKEIARLGGVVAAFVPRSVSPYLTRLKNP